MPKQSIHQIIEEKLGVSEITSKEQLDQLVAELRKGGDAPIKISPQTSK